jgi:ABC-type sugar transport system ATPase subunit
MVHQHFTLADNLSVLDNVMLGTEPLWQPFSRRAAARAAAGGRRSASACRSTPTRASATCRWASASGSRS